MNIQSEIWNSACGTCYNCVYVLPIFRKTLTLTKWEVLYIILTQFFGRAWIWSQKFQIPSVAPVKVVQPHFRKMWPSPIRVIYISSGSEFQGDSRSGVRNLKFLQWHLLWQYLCFSHIFRKYNLSQLVWSIYDPALISKEIWDLKSEISNSHLCRNSLSSPSIIWFGRAIFGCELALVSQYWMRIGHLMPWHCPVHVLAANLAYPQQIWGLVNISAANPGSSEYICSKSRV